jgi:hypothetical protein
MTGVAAWLQTAIAVDDGARRMVVMDESWRMFSHVAIAAQLPVFSPERVAGRAQRSAKNSRSRLGMTTTASTPARFIAPRPL